MPTPDIPEHHDPFPDFPVDPDVTLEADVPPPRIHTAVVAAVAVGGALGAIARWAIAELMPHDRGAFPWDTLLTNVSGCFLIGVLMVLVIERWQKRPLVRPFFGTGILGGFTTFSTYVVDIQRLVQTGAIGTALAYLAATLVLALAATWLGLTTTRRLLQRRARA